MSYRKIVEYKLINVPQGSWNETMEDRVNHLIKQGFQPYGYPFVDHQKWVTLAMVRYEENTNKVIKKFDNSADENKDE